MRPAFLALCCLLLPVPAPAAPGALVIAGGAIAPDNAALARAFLDRRPAGRPAIAIVPAASGEPMASFEAARALFTAHGARAEDIRLVPVATEDDPGTPADERSWANAGSSPSALAAVEGAGAIWFTGGDQARIMATLVTADGSETPLLATIRAAHAAGAVVGGTSAGAAVMSNPMLTGGDPRAAVAAPSTDLEAVATAPGLGLFTAGIVDQHFGQRGRLPRLLFVLARLAPTRRLGFGVDENTAMVVADGRLSVVGAGLVTIADARRARLRSGPGLGLSGLALAWLADGQSMPLP